MLQMLSPFLPRSRSYPNWLADVGGLTALSIGRISPLEVENSSFSNDWPLYPVLTMLLGKMIDGASYGPHGGKLSLLCQG